MAEVYGVKPKMFTKEWWPYFWMYYKWHTIAITAITVLVASTLIECVTATKYDLMVTYMGKSHITQEKGLQLQEELEKVISDADSNGETNVFYLAMNMSDTQVGAEMDYGMEIKHKLDFKDTPNALYLYDSLRVKELSRYPDLALDYLTADEWTTAGEAENEVFVPLKDSTVLAKIGVDSSDMYVAVRRLPEDADDTDKAVFDNALKAAEFLLK